MKVLMLSSKEVVCHHDSYGARLIEQGKAVIQSDEEAIQEAAPCETAAPKAIHQESTEKTVKRAKKQ